MQSYAPDADTPNGSLLCSLEKYKEGSHVICHMVRSPFCCCRPLMCGKTTERMPLL